MPITMPITIPMPIPNSNLVDEAFGLRCGCDDLSGCDDSLAAPVNTKTKKKRQLKKGGLGDPHNGVYLPRYD